MLTCCRMAYFDIPLDLPHAARLAGRIESLLERMAEEGGEAAEASLDAAERLSKLLFRYSEDDDNPAGAEGIRDEAAVLGRALVDAIERDGIVNDRLGQYVRNFFECLELGKEGAEISLRAGENPGSLQRPV